MAWMADWVETEVLTTAKMNQALHEPRVWQGDVNANGNDLTNVGSITFAAGGAYGSGVVYRYDPTAITAAHQVVMADLLPSVTTPVEGSVATVIIQQGAGAPWAVTWSADFHGVSAWTDGAVGEVSTWKFTARADNKWWLESLPIIGMT